MYLHLGKDILIKSRDLIGIFDLEKASTSKRTKEFLVEATKQERIVTVSYEMPKAFVITKDKTVYISQISSQTLSARAGRLSRLLGRGTAAGVANRRFKENF